MAEKQPEIKVNDRGAELDPNGIPYYKWPPFPEPPTGVTIIPFKVFKPSGIKLPLNDDIEVDGLGIPTVRLPVTHDNEGVPKKKRKIKKTTSGKEVLRRNVWWEEWEEGEAQRIRSAKIYDQMSHPKARLSRAVEEFKQVHDWEPISLRLYEWYFKFMYFVGLNDFSIRPKYRRMQNKNQDDEGSDDDVPSKPFEGSESQPVKIESFDDRKHKLGERSTPLDPDERLQQRIERVRELQECRVEAFIENPHLATKIFFSSYFRDCGMMWERMALRDAPRIIEFFLNYLLGTRALYEEEPSLKRALEVARRAKEELPLTMQIGVNIPDELAKCLTAIYGSRVKQVTWSFDLDQENSEPQEDSATQFKAEVEEGGGIIISDMVSGPAGTASASGEEANEAGPPLSEKTSSWGADNTGGTGGWGAGSTTGEQDPEGGWGDNSWAQPEETQTGNPWADPDEHSLMKLLGPTSLPITHTVGYVEESTRYVSSVELPKTNEKSENEGEGTMTSSDLFRQFAKVVLNAYPTFAAPSAPRAAIQPPELIEDPWARISSDNSDSSTAKPRIPRHDPAKDSITMLIDPKVAKDLALGKRMGLGGTFVQIIPNYAADTASVAPPDRGEGQDKGRDVQISSRGSGRTGKKGHASEEDTFWYAEKILQILPSFWTEKQE